MSTTAVTPGAPAAPSTRSNAAPTHSEFLPTDKNYRLTGELPVETPSEEEHAAAARVEPGSEHETETREGEPSSSDSETAAASEAATAQEKKGPAQSKSKATSESRFAKITRENREMRERLARLENPQTVTRETTQASQPAPAAETQPGRTEPKIEDVDAKTGQPKYKTLAEYLADHAKWNREEAVREMQETNSKTERERQRAQSEQIIEKTVNERVDAARKAYTDYDDVAASALAVKDELGRDALFYTKGSHLDGFFLDSDRGHDVLYQIFKDFDTHKHIFARDARGNYKLNPVRQLRELAKIENSLPDKSKATTAPVTRVTQAPRPPHQVSGKGSVGTKDALERAVDEQDSDTYIREANARALAKLRK
jgi:hypothetical protein